MDYINALFSGEYGWLYGSLFIFFARVCDVSIGTVRIILVSKGRQILAPLLGFVEVVIWLAAAGSVMQNLNQPIFFISYALGFAAGTYIGIMIERVLALGNVIVRIVTRREACDLIRVLRDRHYRITNIHAEGNEGDVSVIFTIVKRKHLPQLLEVVLQHNPNAFYTVEDVRAVAQEVYQPSVTTKVPSILAVGGQGK
ncbi:MAG: DUF2179 domain-containing protein [bacterium]|jgi:uncharacterized protein YebE (UPF0316 family)